MDELDFDAIVQTIMRVQMEGGNPVEVIVHTPIDFIAGMNWEPNDEE